MRNVCMESFQVDLKVGIIDDEGRTGRVTYGCGHGIAPTAETIERALTVCAKTASEQGFRLMDRHEYMQDELGAGRVSIPGPKQFPNAEKWQTP